MKLKDQEKTTKERLLDTAELLYSENGIEATSLRAITDGAGANLAAVNYHFGSKEALTEAVFARRLMPLNQERLRLLDEAESSEPGEPPRLEAVLYSFFTPTIRVWREHPPFMRLAGRLQFEPSEKLHHFFLSQFEEVIRRYEAALARALPDMPRKELFWRMHFLIGAMVHTWTCHHDLDHISGGLCSNSDLKEIVDSLVAFGAAGLRAPVHSVDVPS